MKFSGKAIMSFSLILISVWVALSALKWPFRSALFPVVVGSAVFLMALTEFFLTMTGRKEKDEDRSRIDFKLSEDVPRAQAIERTVSMCIWILGLFFLVILVGFTLSIPVFFVLFLRLKGREGWGISLGLAAAAYGAFWLLFVRLLHTSLPQGLLFRIIGWA